MSAAQHTPGPWVHHPEDNIITTPNGFCKLLEWQARSMHVPQEERDANARLIAAAPELLEEVEREYAELADINNEWPGRNTLEGQAKLIRLRDLISRATGRSERDVQDDYGMRAAIAKATGGAA